MNTLAVSLVAGVLGNPGIPYYGPSYQYIPHVGPGDAYVARGGERADGRHKHPGRPALATPSTCTARARPMRAPTPCRKAANDR